jgi:DegV family protein with EDD domain
MPSTSQVSPASLKTIYKELIETGHDILAVFVSEKLSGTIASANQALESFPGGNIEIVDSYSTAMAMGFQVLAAARAAAEGADLAECKALVEDARYKGGLVFAVNTLEFLHRGGRIGGGTRFLATALNIKPILELQDGVIEAVERVRTRKKSLKRLIELTEERIDGRKPLRIATLHANARQEAQDLLAEAAAHFKPDETIFSEVSPVVGTHAGPGTIGLAFIVGN